MTGFLQVVAAVMPVGLFGTFFVVLWMRSRTFKCPSCARQVGRDALQLAEVRCPKCHWRAVSATHADYVPPTPQPQTEARTCRACERLLTPQLAVRLWDGADYCQRCLDDVNPRLAELAARTDRLEEVVSIDARRIGWRTFLFGWSGGMLFFGTIFTIGAGWQGLLASQLLVVPITSVFGLVAASAARMGNPRRVSLSEGELVIRSGVIGSRRIDLGDCEWYVGDASAATSSKHDFLLRGERVLIVLHAGKGQNDQEGIVAVGESEEDRELWKSALQVAGLPRRTAWERRRTWRITANLFGVLAILGAFPAAIVVSRVVERLILQAGGRPGLATLVSFLGFLPGSLYAVAYVAVSWPWGAHPRVRSSKTAGEIRSMQLRTAGWTAFVVAVKIALPILLWMRDIPLGDRIPAAVLAVCSALVVGYDIGGRAAKWERVRQDAADTLGDGWLESDSGGLQ